MRDSYKNVWCSVRPGPWWNACAACSRRWACRGSLSSPTWAAACPRNAWRVPCTCSPMWWRPGSGRQADAPGGNQYPPWAVQSMADEGKRARCLWPPWRKEHDMTEELWRASAVELVTGICDKRFSCVDVITSVVERIHALNPKLNAIVV